MKIKEIIFLAIISLGIITSPAVAAQSADTEKNVKGVLKTDPAKKMIDLFLSELPSGREIMDAKVRAAITYPDGRKVEKELIGMRMGEVYSFMNSLDFSKPGRYSFDVSIQTSGSSVKLEFTQTIP